MKPFKVVCIGGDWIRNPHPIKGEIYTVFSLDNDNRFPEYKGWYYLTELNVPDGNYRTAYNPSVFRPVDDTFGEWVEETLMKELEYQEALKQ